MKFKLLLLACCSILFTNCNEDDDIVPVEKEVLIPFTGKWDRQFEVGPGQVHTVSYSIYQDSLNYKLSGPIGNADYSILKDTFLVENNRYVGHTKENKYYLLFIKEVSDKSISIYKQGVKDISEALSIEVPEKDTTENHGWNTFSK